METSLLARLDNEGLRLAISKAQLFNTSDGRTSEVK